MAYTCLENASQEIIINNFLSNVDNDLFYGYKNSLQSSLFYILLIISLPTMSDKHPLFHQFLTGLFITVMLFSCSVKKKSMTASRSSSTTSVTGSTAGSNSGSIQGKETAKLGQSYSAYNLDVADYIKQYSGFAIKEMNDFGVPASVILAQGIHESGAGKSLLAQEANNHFGVKCTSEWNGKSYHMNDDSPNECFRKYASPEESYDDHMKFLQRKRYASLFTLDKEDYKGWALGLKRCGYATNPRYSEILISMIERYNLTRFDHAGITEAMPLAKKSSGPKPTEASVSENTHQPVLASSVAAKNIIAGAEAIPNSAHKVILDTIHQKVYITDTIYQYAYQKAQNAANRSSVTTNKTERNDDLQNKAGRTSPLHAPVESEKPKTSAQPGVINDGSTPDLQIPLNYTVKQGDTLYGIARRYKLKLIDLQKLNNLPDTSVKIDQLLLLQ